MKLIRWGEAGAERPGVLDAAGTRRDVSSFGASDWDEDFFGDGGLAELSKWLQQNPLASLPEVPVSARWGSPVARPSKLVCIGLNYAEHARETGKALPPEPLIFFKSSTALCGPYDDLVLPPESVRTDWEVELAVVIGKTARRVSEADALAHVAGYSILIDYSERDWQYNRGGQWSKGKSFDTFAPMGPWLLTADEVADPTGFSLQLHVNGLPRQTGTASDMIFSIARVVSHLSECMTLLPGDVISTGTPSGVAQGMAEAAFLQPGDVVESSISELGAQRQVVR